MADFHKPGVARLKPEFVLADYRPKIDTEYLSQETKDEMAELDKDKEAGDEPQAKRIKLKGRNKKRPIVGKKRLPADKLCPAIVQERDCQFGEKCKFNHDLKKYLDEKPPDLGEECYLFETYGKCPCGVTCRYAKPHLDKDFKNITKPGLETMEKKTDTVSNVLTKDLQHLLWKRKYDFSKTDAVLEKLCPSANHQKKLAETYLKKQETKKAESEIAAERSENTEPENKNAASSQVENGSNDSNIQVINSKLDIPPAPIKKVVFADKLYLAPLTTVGNLPFRRICKQYGADITCGEMAMCTNLLQGQQSEWALLKRHKSEDLFGVQLCGGYPDSMTRCAQLICENIDVDFIDINCGCPIDLIFNKGEGSALMGRQSKFEQIVTSMKSVMNVPLTVKMRTGVHDNKNIAHTLVPHLKDWGVAMTTLHGRSRTQRYTKTADWEYINNCAEIADPMPLFGNGDILTYEDYNMHRKNSAISGVMLARGALIKPWLFTEIKEQRHWDISSTERFDMLKDYVHFGMDNWGSDQQGLEITRRFLLEWLSFLYRYIPVGILEHVPQLINERPPFYRGRDEMETLMASPNCGDWVKISEMLLGKVPDGFTFLPKHKANAYK